MKELNKDNLQNFLEYYHYLHDSVITNINYNVTEAQIELLINTHWPKENNKKKLKMIFELVEECNNKEIMPWDYINNVFLKYIKIKNKEFICFASDEKDPFVYIVCENIKYEIS